MFLLSIVNEVKRKVFEKDSFNHFINSTDYKLDRGEIGSNKIHQDKLNYKINESEA